MAPELEEKIVRQLVAMAVNDFKYGETASHKAIEGLGSYLHVPLAVNTLLAIARDDFRYGEKAQMLALNVLGNRNQA